MVGADAAVDQIIANLTQLVRVEFDCTSGSLRSFERRPATVHTIVFIDYGKQTGKEIVDAIVSTPRRALEKVTIMQASIRDGAETMTSETWSEAETAGLIARLAAFGVELEVLQRGDWD